jgi:hypothetical protein
MILVVVVVVVMMMIIYFLYGWQLKKAETTAVDVIDPRPYYKPTGLGIDPILRHESFLRSSVSGRIPGI